MRKAVEFLKKILDPKEIQLRELDLDQVLRALESQTVRERWTDKLIDLIREANRGLDRMLDKADRAEKWEVLAVERRTILRCLSLILDVRDELESEKVAEEARDRVYERFRGAQAALNLDARKDSLG